MRLPVELHALAWAVEPHWPQGDEAALRRCAKAWREAAGPLRSALPDADRAGARAVAALHGQTAEVVRASWDSFTVGDSGHVEMLAAACTDLAALCDGAADVLEEAKHQLVRALLDLAGEVAVLVALAPVTLGMSLAGIAVAGAATQERARDIAVRAGGVVGLSLRQSPAGWRVSQLVELLRGYRPGGEAGVGALPDPGSLFDLGGGGVGADRNDPGRPPVPSGGDRQPAALSGHPAAAPPPGVLLPARRSGRTHLEQPSNTRHTSSHPSAKSC